MSKRTTTWYEIYSPYQQDPISRHRTLRGLDRGMDRAPHGREVWVRDPHDGCLSRLYAEDFDRLFDGRRP